MAIRRGGAREWAWRLTGGAHRSAAQGGPRARRERGRTLMGRSHRSAAQRGGERGWAWGGCQMGPLFRAVVYLSHACTERGAMSSWPGQHRVRCRTMADGRGGPTAMTRCHRDGSPERA